MNMKGNNMQRRNGFVSNSSSTSFIVQYKNNNLIKFCNEHTIKLYKIKDVIKHLKRFKRIQDKLMLMKNDFEEDQSLMPRFVFDDLYVTDQIFYLDELEEAIKKYPNAYITSPVDRDWAYNEEDLKFAIEFASDL